MAERMGWWSLAEENRGIAGWYVNRYYAHLSVEERDELVAEAMVPLVMAAIHYDPKYRRNGKPVKFTTYATNCIRMHFQRMWTAANYKCRGGGVTQTFRLSEYRLSDGKLAMAEEMAVAPAGAIEEAEDDEFMAALMAGTKLSRRQKALFYLRYVDGVGIKEAAERCGLTIPAAKKQLEQVRLRLRRTSMRIGCA